MMATLSGKKIAFLTAQVGVEKAELESPWQAVLEADGVPTHIAPEPGPVRSMVGDVDEDRTFEPDVTVADAAVADYDALVIPGGTVNADKVRGDAASVALVGGAQVDAQDEDAVLDGGRRVADDGEVHEVLLRLLEEAATLFATDGRQRPPFHGGGPLAEAGEHRVDIKAVCHGRTVPGRRRSALDRLAGEERIDRHGGMAVARARAAGDAVGAAVVRGGRQHVRGPVRRRVDGVGRGRRCGDLGGVDLRIDVAARRRRYVVRQVGAILRRRLTVRDLDVDLGDLVRRLDDDGR
jgi:hypothetical protein